MNGHDGGGAETDGRSVEPFESRRTRRQRQKNLYSRYTGISKPGLHALCLYIPRDEILCYISSFRPLHTEIGPYTLLDIFSASGDQHSTLSFATFLYMYTADLIIYFEFLRQIFGIFCILYSLVREERYTLQAKSSSR